MDMAAHLRSIGLPPLVLSLIRWSSGPQGFGSTEERQDSGVTAWAGEQGWPIDHRLVLPGISAAKGKHRDPRYALGQFLQQLDEKLIPEGAALLSEYLDRVSREMSIKSAAQVLDMAEKGVRLVITSSGDVYDKVTLKDPEVASKLEQGLNQAWAENHKKGVRVKRAFRQKREAVEKNPQQAVDPSNLSFWLEVGKDGEYNYRHNSHASTMLKMVENCITGLSWEKNAKALADEPEKYRHPRQGKFTAAMVSQAVQNPAIYGGRRYYDIEDQERTGKDGKKQHVKVKVPKVTWGQWRPLIDRDDPELGEQALKAAIHARFRSRGDRSRSAASPNLFHRLSRCDKCDAPLVRLPTTRNGSNDKPKPDGRRPRLLRRVIDAEGREFASCAAAARFHHITTSTAYLWAHTDRNGWRFGDVNRPEEHDRQWVYLQCSRARFPDCGNTKQYRYDIFEGQFFAYLEKHVANRTPQMDDYEANIARLETAKQKNETSLQNLYRAFGDNPDDSLKAAVTELKTKIAELERETSRMKINAPIPPAFYKNQIEAYRKYADREASGLDQDTIDVLRNKLYMGVERIVESLVLDERTVITVTFKTPTLMKVEFRLPWAAGRRSRLYWDEKQRAEPKPKLSEAEEDAQVLSDCNYIFRETKTDFLTKIELRNKLMNMHPPRPWLLNHHTRCLEKILDRAGIKLLMVRNGRRPDGSYISQRGYRPRQFFGGG